jgi:hypothetical protein
MKLLLVVLVSMVSFLGVNGQGFSPAESSTSISTVGNVEIAGKTFQGGTSRTGSLYIMRTAKSGNVYKSYLGMPTGKSYNSSPVYTANSKGIVKYFYFTINPNTGYPKRNYLQID